MIKFSIITPSYNEEKDIRETLESFLNLTYPNKEIIVVDDSSDKTGDIVLEYASRGVRLIRGNGDGCCEAVNLGIEKATGDVIINADADVRLPSDFLERLAMKYEAGADWVLGYSITPNTKHLFSRFIAALNEVVYQNKDVYYEEGFSCKRDLALKLGMFGQGYPLKFCRDWLLGKKLTEGGYKKIYDPSIVVEHEQPDNLKEFWQKRKSRGRFGPLKNYFMDKYSKSFIFFKLLYKDILFILRFALIVPAIQQAWRISRKSEKNFYDFFPFLWANFLLEFARIVGEWSALADIYKLSFK